MLTVENGNNSGVYFAGSKVKITAQQPEDAPAGQPFQRWIAKGVELSASQATSKTIEITMPEGAVELKACFGYKLNLKNCVLVGEECESCYVYSGTNVNIQAHCQGEERFHSWTTTGIKFSDEQSKSDDIEFTMPAKEVSVTCNLGYYLNVTCWDLGWDGCTGSGVYLPGEIISVKAELPEETDMAFYRWQSEALQLTDAQKKAETVKFIMPEKYVELNIRLGYKLTVINGTGSGVYAPRDDEWENRRLVQVTASPKEKQTFKYWRAADGYVDDDGSSYIGDTWYSNEQLSSEKLQIEMPDYNLTLTAVMDSEVKITDFKVLPHWPWSDLVDITYSIECPDPNQEIYCTFVGMDTASEAGIVLEGLSGDGLPNVPMKAGGPYKTVWKAGANYSGFSSGTFKIGINYSRKYVAPSVPARTMRGNYVVIDLSGGPDAASYPVRYTKIGPDVSKDTCRTTELWLRQIEPGTFTMGSPEDEVGRYDGETQHKVTLTQPFYIGVFECTQRQWELVMGERPSEFGDESNYATLPVECVSYYDIRGDEEVGYDWPEDGHAVDAWSFMGQLQAKTGLTFDLPTEAQWEYACRAGTTTALNSGDNLRNEYEDSAMDKVGRYAYNGGDEYGTAKVGSYQPNNWNLYDMHGNVWEWCLDWWYEYGESAVTDPVGASSDSGYYRVMRGGGWDYDADYCRSARRYYGYPGNDYSNDGFRVALPIAK